ncbi:MAG: caspase family protein [Myxococcales bacterium]|nr:caspase family protein [Myxococcales bacterium]
MSAPLLLGLLAAMNPVEPASEAPAVFAVIVAHNQSSDGSLAPLSYADDDGARYAELLGLASSQVSLLSVLDAPTQRLHPAVAKMARAPTRGELLSTLSRTFQKIEAARDAGRRTVFYFVYVGHGSIGDDGEGTMHLSDGRFTRADLYQEVLARSPATVNHVIIDACHAYFMVARRGGDTAQMEAALQSFLQKEGLDAYPNTGVLLSTSKAKEVHEWSRFGAGIFSHEVRSALVGAADVDGDGRVTYDETRAFIAAANARVDNPMARLEVYARPPAIHLNEPLFDRSWAQDAPRLVVPQGRAGRWYLEDERGVRYADFHSADQERLDLTLVPQPRYYLRNDTSELEIDLGVLKHADAGDLAPEPLALAMRGSEDATFQKDLFALAFGRAYYEGYRSAAPSPEPAVTAFVPPKSSGVSARRWTAVGLGSAGVAAAATGLGLWLAADAKANQYTTYVGDDDDVVQLKGTAQDYTTASRVLVGVGGGLVAAATALWLWPE